MFMLIKLDKDTTEGVNDSGIVVITITKRKNMRKESTTLAVSILMISILILAGGVALGQTATPTPNQTASTIPTITPTTTPTITPTPTPYATIASIPNQTANVTETSTPNATTTPNATSTPNQTITATGNENQNVIVNQSVTVNQNVTISAPITNEEKAKATNIAINLTVNIGIVNPTVVDVQREEENEQNLRVRVKDKTGEIIVVIVTPNGEAKQETQNVQSFTQTENNFTGKHVSFQFTNDSILNFALDGKLIFKSIRLGFSSTNVTILGSEIRIFDVNNIVIIHDTTSGIITESSSEQIESILEVASDISTKVTGKRVDLSEIHASILSSNPESDEVVPSVSGNIIHVTINHGRSTFIAKSINDQFEDRVVEGIAENKVGNVINIEAENSQDITTFGVDTTINKVVQNTVSINVSSEVTEGRVMALRISKDVLANLNLRVLVDGNEIKPAIDIDDLFKIDKLAFLIVIGQDVEVLVSIPKFSEHEVVITSAAPATITATPATATITTTTVPPTTPPVTPSPTKGAPGFTSGLILAVLAVLYLLTKSRKK